MGPRRKKRRRDALGACSVRTAAGPGFGEVDGLLPALLLALGRVVGAEHEQVAVRVKFRTGRSAEPLVPVLEDIPPTPGREVETVSKPALELTQRAHDRQPGEDRRVRDHDACVQSRWARLGRVSAARPRRQPAWDVSKDIVFARSGGRRSRPVSRRRAAL